MPHHRSFPYEIVENTIYTSSYAITGLAVTQATETTVQVGWNNINNADVEYLVAYRKKSDIEFSADKV